MSERPVIEFIDLKAQRQHIGKAMDEAILKVVHDGNYILGQQVQQFETELAAFCGAKHAIGVANGTDALILVLEALGIGSGDAVICPSFTFAATAEVVAWMGATPVFAEIDEATYNIDPKSLGAALETAKQHKLNPRALISVDLFGQACDYEPIEAFCKQNGLILISDSAQGYGARYNGRVAGAIGDFATTSFFPAKPLGCYGDGGAILTEDAELAALMRSLRVHGQGSDKYDNVRIGMTARLDTIQAAILIEKLAVFADEIEARNRVAARYNAALADVCQVPFVPDGHVSVWAQYTILVPGDRRDAIAATLKSAGVPTAVYYPMPLHKQVAYRHYPVAGNGLPVSEDLSRRVLSLPMHPYLDEATQDRVVEAVRAAVA